LHFSIRRRIVGVAVSSARVATEMRATIFGVTPARRTMRVADRGMPPQSPRRPCAGLALVPEDRKKQGMILEWPCATT